MALTLKAAITETQTTIDVNGTDALSNGDLYTIEDEQVFVVTSNAGSIQPGETAWQRLGVSRGSLGTTEVAHDAGTAMTLVTTPLGAGGVQTIRLLESVIDVSTVVVTAGRWVGDELFPLIEGTWILDCWVQVTATPNITGASYGTFEWTTDVAGDPVQVPAGGFDVITGGFQEDVAVGGIQRETAQVGVGNSFLALVGSRLDLADGATMKARPLPCRVSVACNLIPAIGTDGTAGTSGTVRLYALIAEPLA